MLWPIFVPFAILLVETGRRRRTATGVIQVLGLGVGLYLLYFIVRFPVTARVPGRSIFYDSPHFVIGGVLVIYLLATCVSGLSSSHRCINGFGVLAFVLAVAAYQVSVMTFVSVWCFFAAVLSLLVLRPLQRPDAGMPARPGAFVRAGCAVMRRRAVLDIATEPTRKPAMTEPTPAQPRSKTPRTGMATRRVRMARHRLADGGAATVIRAEYGWRDDAAATWCRA